MLAKLKKLLISFVFIAASCLLVSTNPTPAANKPPPQGEPLPSFELAVPQNAAERAYLGLADSGEFTVPQVKAQVVVIEIFSMY